MQINGKIIEWKHLRDLYHKVHSMAVQSAGLLLVPKLKMEHIELTSFSQMRVDLAAQVSNCTMSTTYLAQISTNKVYGNMRINA